MCIEVRTRIHNIQKYVTVFIVQRWLYTVITIYLISANNMGKRSIELKSFFPLTP